MRHEVKFTGFGGQGIILSAVIVGRAATMYDGKHAVQSQSYGPEARGGASSSTVIISDEPIQYPKVLEPTIYVIMSEAGFLKFGAGASPEAVMLIDSGLVQSRPECRCIEIPATMKAKDILGKPIFANIIMLGALVAATGIVSEEAMQKAVLDSVPKGTEDLNMKALRLGIEIASNGGE
ncbi:2-oxoglutarate ferredoxin oxidoreductase subunit gamma [Methanocalculus chunghsingensis]|uniref:2-oxoglutarate ferredoxin oxidoreductase subunit gamma n=1 Tax=Methanocalculus chunghsingensis TaxID=156457 RepID=A0A8J7W7Z7_9EURY|nr:2-oxoacid:acceptor oxidoreductase family protein [Methanocalculus chunghsingensis]MBR1368072.1 2-oxoglutarate ferredoxin oxidoreductase subunit gamma [Methanocalculus chunghsingensis]